MQEPLLQSRPDFDGTGGEWSKRNPRFMRSLLALFRRDIVTKLRNFTSVFEFTGACLVSFLLYPIWIFARDKVPASANPEILPPFNPIIQFFSFFANYKRAVPRFVMMPNTKNVRTLYNDFTLLLNLTAISNATKINYKSAIVDTVDEMEKFIYQTDSNAVGIHWLNSDSETAIIHPKFHIYQQSNVIEVQETIIEFLLLELLNRNFSVKNLNPFEIFGDITVERQPFPALKADQEYNCHIAFAIFAVFPLILATMPNVQDILDDKDSKITTYMLLMGMTELQHWIVNFTMMFIPSLIPYVIFGAQMCYWYGMKGTDFSLLAAVTVLFIISHIFFMFCVLCLMTKSEHGRSQAVASAIFAIFFAYVHFFYTLMPQASMKVRHGFSVLPISAYQLTVMTLYGKAMNDNGGYKWSEIYTDAPYPVILGIKWLALDSVIYFVLFLVLNTFMPREFGVSPMLIRNVFKLSAWKTLFTGENANCRVQSMQSKVAISIKGLNKVYKGYKSVEAVKNVNFEVNSGEVIVMIGPNGAGKSSIINTISCAVKATSGSVSLFEGPETSNFHEIHKYLGICFQDNVLCDLLSVEEHFALFGALRGIDETELAQAISYLCHNLQMDHVLKIRAKDLSGGQKRKLCLSLAILGNPPLIFMDEPTAGVDVQARQLIWKMIATLKGSTCIITSHALEEAEAVSTRLFIVSEGSIPFMGTSTELRHQFNCGYLLRVELEDGDINPIFELCEKVVPGSKRCNERKDVIIVPVNNNVVDLLTEIENNGSKYAIKSYTFGVEQLEDTLIRMIQSADAATN